MDSRRKVFASIDWFEWLIQAHEHLERICDKLQDAESREIFRARINYAMGDNGDVIREAALLFGNDWMCLGLPKYAERAGADEIIIFGCGLVGLRSMRAMEIAKVPLACFCDSDPQLAGTFFEGVPVISREELVANHANAMVVVASGRHAQEIEAWLLDHGFPSERIFVPIQQEVVSVRPRQYFDIFEPAPDEVFIDAGAYDGCTVQEFAQWCHGTYRKVYSMEPMAAPREVFMQRVGDMRDVELCPYAAWSRRETLSFNEVGPGSSVAPENGAVEVEAIDIDTLLAGERATFIKMDIEGAELEALRGAANTIRTWKPRLAISVYHKPWDVVELTEYILELVPEYELRLRHYSSNKFETVLYAYL